MTNVLFVTWDGPGSTYLAGLFLPIFRLLADRGFQFHVLQFGWGDERDCALASAACAEAGVPYRRVRVWRRPVALGSLATVITGIASVRRAVRDWSIDVLMPRSYLPALAAIRARRFGAKKLPVLLDADGLPNDERREFGGGSGEGLTDSLLSALERHAVCNADAIAVRTARAVDILRGRTGGIVPESRFTIVANARDPAGFRLATPVERSATRNALGISDSAPLLLYVGTALSGKYRGDMVRELFRLVHRRRPDARLLLVMPDPGEGRALMAAESPLADATVHVSAMQSQVPALIGAADLGLSLIHATPSMQAASAIKTGEYLLCGVPVLASSGVGGIERIIDRNSGWCLEDDDPASLDLAGDWFCDTVLTERQRFREGARRLGLAHFSLERAIPAYESALSHAIAQSTCM